MPAAGLLASSGGSLLFSRISASTACFGQRHDVNGHCSPSLTHTSPCAPEYYSRKCLHERIPACMHLTNVVKTKTLQANLVAQFYYLLIHLKHTYGTVTDLFGKAPKCCNTVTETWNPFGADSGTKNSMDPIPGFYPGYLGAASSLMRSASLLAHVPDLGTAELWPAQSVLHTCHAL